MSRFFGQLRLGTPTPRALAQVNAVLLGPPKRLGKLVAESNSPGIQRMSI